MARFGHTATLLKDGRVLIAGGFTTPYSTGLVTYAVLASAELYDPATGEFSPTGSMSVARYGHTATLLPDGRVLIAGGSSEYAVNRRTTEFLATAELYDPATGTFSASGSMAVSRGGHTATLLPDGRVLIAGGAAGPSDQQSVASAELYDPASGTFSTTGSMAVGRVQQTAMPLNDGRVLIAGGMFVAPGVWTPTLASAELYDTRTGRFTPTGSMTDSRVSDTATKLADGRVLLAGGWGGETNFTLSSAELYDPKTGTFSSTGSMATPRAYHTATLLSNGLVIVVGGNGDSGDMLTFAQTYDPATGEFTRLPGATTERTGHSATVLANGSILIVGGQMAVGSNAMDSAELYRP